FQQGGGFGVERVVGGETVDVEEEYVEVCRQPQSDRPLWFAGSGHGRNARCHSVIGRPVRWVRWRHGVSVAPRLLPTPLRAVPLGQAVHKELSALGDTAQVTPDRHGYAPTTSAA